MAEFARFGTSARERAERTQYISELKAKLAEEKHKVLSRSYYRRKRGGSDREEVLHAHNRAVKARHRTKAHLADSQRPRDPIELMEAELATLQGQPASPSHDQRISYLTEAVRTLKELAEVRLSLSNGRKRRSEARTLRRALLAEAKDTTEIDRRIARLTQESESGRLEITKLRAQALLLGLKETRRRKGPQAIDEARFRAFEQALVDPTTIHELRLGEFEHELADLLHEESDGRDAEFFDEIWREAEAADAEQQDAGPPPDPAAAVHTGLQALQNELHAQRVAFEMELEDLVHQHAALSQTLPGPGSSRHAEGIQRLQALEAERLSLQQRWRQQMQRRLDLARQELRTWRSLARLRDEAAEADLAQQIALLEHEVRYPSF